MTLGRTSSGAIKIKTDGGLRAVECGCCGGGEPGCCMYPADQLGTLYTAADLPDAVTVNWSGRYTGSMSKSGSGYAANGYTLDAQSGLWVLSDTATSTTRTVGNCLIRGDGNLTDNGDLVEDQFAGSYVVTVSDWPGIPDPRTRTVERVGLCAWEEPGYPPCWAYADTYFGVLWRQDLYFSVWDQSWYTGTMYIEVISFEGNYEDDFVWYCAGYWGNPGKKVGNQNSPVGEYWDIWNNQLVATVTEA